MALAELSTQIFYGVAILNLAVWLFIVLTAIAALTKPSFWTKWQLLVQGWATKLSLLAAVLATGGSLWLSEIMGLNPCLLCWWQRIFMYPLVIILGVQVLQGKAMRAGTRLIAMLMSLIGFGIAAYHYGIQRVGFLQKTIPCTADASCSTMYLGYWGFYSIPLMAATAFALIFVLQKWFAKSKA